MIAHRNGRVIVITEEADAYPRPRRLVRLEPRAAIAPRSVVIRSTQFVGDKPT